MAQEKRYYSSSKNNSNIDDYIVLKKDTLFASLEKKVPVTFQNKKDYFNYKRTVFPYPNKDFLRQWKSNINVYLNKKIDKSIRKDFEEFIASFPKTENLKISLVKKIENANFHITVGDNIQNIYKGLELSKEELKKKLYYNINYKIESNKDSYISCVLEFDPKKVTDEKKLLKGLKTLFFSSLGRFYLNTYNSEKSLLSSQHPEVDYLTDFDIKILKYHYQNIYNYKIYRKDFDSNHVSYEE